MSVISIAAANNAYLQAVQSDQTNPPRPHRQDFDALAQALSAGDLAGARQAFAALQQDMENMRPSQAGHGHPHRHYQTNSAQAGSAATAAGSNAVAATRINTTA